MAVFFRFCRALMIVSLFFCAPVWAGIGLDEAGKLLPEKIDKFIAQGKLIPASDNGLAVSRNYRAATGEILTVGLTQAASETNAYSLLTQNSLAAQTGVQGTPKFDRSGALGTVAVVWPDRIHFFKGKTFATVTAPKASDKISALAQALAAPMDAGEGEIPALVKHLPDWQNAQDRALYAVTPAMLEEFAGPQPIFSALNWQGGAEAVVTAYDKAQLVIVEFTTPQLATANDAAIQAKLKELAAAGQPQPSLCRRVGNYGVFVFNAPDQNAAEQLAGQIKYEQTVQWLGDNPYRLIKAQKRYIAFTTDIFLSVMKASGLAILLVLGLGGVIGALVFKHRRAQQTTAALYSDAGGMMRLNLDELTIETDADGQTR